MKVTEGTLGRVLVLRLEDGDDIVASITEAARTHGVRSGVVWLLGAARRGEFVVGPRKTEIPPERWAMGFDEGRELAGVGTIFPSQGEPSVHVHAAAGRGDTSLTGCIQPGTETFLIVEAVIVEILGTGAQRKADPSGRFHLLDLPAAGPRPDDPKDPS